jgi:hypothetical protein
VEQEAAAQDDPWVLKSVSALSILRAYLSASTEARDMFGEGHILSADWNKEVRRRVKLSMEKYEEPISLNHPPGVRHLPRV